MNETLSPADRKGAGPSPRWAAARRGLLGGGSFAAAVWILVIVVMNWRTGEFFDFSVFYAGATAVVAGRSPYILPNLNPPTFVLLTAPLALLPIRVSWLVWLSMNAAAFGMAMKLATAGRNCPDRALVQFIALAHASTAAQVVLGQVAWLLSLPLTLAWKKSSSGQWRAAGVWFGVALAFKPFLLPMLGFALVSSEWRRLTPWALVTAAAVTLGGLPFLGGSAYQTWWTTGINAWHSTDQPTIASLSGTLYRNGVGAAVSLVVSAVPWLLIVVCWRQSGVDRQWLLGIAAAILTSPLGWIHYTAWLLPLTIACWPEMHRGWRALGLAAGCVPWMAVVMWPSVQPIYPVSVLALIAATLIGARALHGRENIRVDA